jgi:hypothetical protein
MWWIISILIVVVLIKIRNRNKVILRENGDVDYDPNSRLPNFVDYNNVRRDIAKQKKLGKKELSGAFSVRVSEELEKDGYCIKFEPNNDHMHRHIIQW